MSENQDQSGQVHEDEHFEDTCTSKTCIECLEPHFDAVTEALPSNEFVWIVFANGQRLLKKISTVFALCEGCDKKHELSSFMHEDVDEDDEDQNEDAQVDA